MFRCILGEGEKLWLRKRGMCDLILKRSAISDRSDPKLICTQTPKSSIWPSEFALQRDQPWARTGQWLCSFLCDLPSLRAMAIALRANACRDPAALSHERSASCWGAAHVLIAQPALLKSLPKGMFQADTPRLANSKTLYINQQIKKNNQILLSFLCCDSCTAL